MIPARWKERLHKDGWLLAALGVCVGLCLLMGPEQEIVLSDEERISRVVSAMAGAGSTQVAIYYDQQDVPCGALVLARGAGDVGVRLQVNRAVSTLLGLDPSQVAVYPLEGGTP